MSTRARTSIFAAVVFCLGCTGAEAPPAGDGAAPSPAGPVAADVDGCSAMTGSAATPCAAGEVCANWPPTFQMEGYFYLSKEPGWRSEAVEIYYDYSDTAAPKMRADFGTCPPIPLGLPFEHPESLEQACSFYLVDGKVFLTPAPVAASAPASGAQCCLVFDPAGGAIYPPNPEFPSVVAAWGTGEGLAPVTAPVLAQAVSFLPSGGTPCGFYGYYEDLTAEDPRGALYHWPAAFSGHMYGGTVTAPGGGVTLPEQYLQILYTRFTPAPDFAVDTFNLPAACQVPDLPFCVEPPASMSVLGDACSGCHGAPGGG